MFKKITLPVIVLVLISACSAPASIPATATPTEQLGLVATVFESTQTPLAYPTPEGNEDECENPFYPVSDEATWTYNISSGVTAVHTMAADDFGKFTINITGGDSTFTVDGQCTPEGIVLMDTTYTGEYGSSTVATVTNSGVTLPKDIGQGAGWTQTLNVTVGEQTSTIESNYTAVGFENITVPAGDFYALKVEQSGYVTVFGRQVDMHGFHWYAEGVGVIKSAMDGAPTVELVSYDIPE